MNYSVNVNIHNLVVNTLLNGYHWYIVIIGLPSYGNKPELGTSFVVQSGMHGEKGGGSCGSLNSKSLSVCNNSNIILFLCVVTVQLSSVQPTDRSEMFYYLKIL